MAAGTGGGKRSRTGGGMIGGAVWFAGAGGGAVWLAGRGGGSTSGGASGGKSGEPGAPGAVPFEPLQSVVLQISPSENSRGEP